MVSLVSNIAGDKLVLNLHSTLLHLQPLEDWLLSLGVTCLVAIDLVILTIHTVVEYLHGDLEAVRIPNRERVGDIVGVSYRYTQTSQPRLPFTVKCGCATMRPHS